MDQFSIIQKYSFLTLGEEEGKYWRYFLSLCPVVCLCLPSLAPGNILLWCL